jgi:hypothetical protein
MDPSDRSDEPAGSANLQPALDERVDRAAGEPPIVARLVVEIRSDGSRTIARGALEDASAGQRVAIRAEGATPTALALSLARALFQAPMFSARAVARALLGRPRRSPPRK